uniref:Rap guanine nucleotide exchange factor 5-like n=1 Tax=Cynoglossus semilaevis TaxID=244447 RepID=A0A3P8UX31_CYNSE
MGSRPQPRNLWQGEGRLLHAALVEQEEDEDAEEECSSDSTSRAEPLTMPTFDVPYFRYIDDEGAEEEEEWSSSRSLSSIEEDSSTDSVVSDRFVVVAGTPEKILEHLLNDLTLDDNQGKESDTLLDDFLLPYPVFMSTSDLCQALLGQYPKNIFCGREDRKEALERKQKVLHLVSQWMSLCKDFLRDEEPVKVFMKTLYLTTLGIKTGSPVLTVTEKWGKNKSNLDGYNTLCHVYVTMDVYLSIKVHGGVLAQELLHIVAERMDVPQEELALVAVTFPGGRVFLQPQDRVFSDSLRPLGRLHICRKDAGEFLFPLIDNSEVQQRSARMFSLNTWDVAVALTNFDWTIFNSIHEQQLVYFTFSRHAGSHHTVALELLLQRCNEVQLWVMTEVLLCPTLCRRVQLIKKFIKIAAHCKAQRNLNCFFAVIMGLNAAAVGRLTQTWEKIPGKFKKLFSELETMTDPSLNHKAYRDSFKKMKAPKIPFLPLLLKDITFIHEGNKTFHDNLVNFEKLHMIADTVRLIRQCQTDPMGLYLQSPSPHPDVRAYVDYLHIIDNQQTLFELSHRLEPRA